MSLEEFPSLLFWSKLQNNQYQLFFEYLVEFTSEATGAGICLWKICNYNFHFFSKLGAI